MGNKLSISIITPTFNRADELDYLLRSISKQTYPLKNIEFIVSDDGSHDNTEKVDLMDQIDLLDQVDH